MLRHLSCFCPSTKAWVTKAMFRFRGFMDCKSSRAIEMFTVSMRAPPERHAGMATRRAIRLLVASTKITDSVVLRLIDSIKAPRAAL